MKFSWAKGKGNDGIITNDPSNKLVSLPSLEALLFDPSLYEEIPIEDPYEGAFFSLGDLFSGEVV